MRNLGLIITFWLASFAMPGISFALGLGEIDVSSFLNQPLKAEIKVISARPGEIDDLLVSLASRDSFARAGLSRPNHLSDLRFAVQKSDAGDEATILVTTKNAIKEPFLNFLVEADWSKGRVLREFTILLDPPFYTDSTAQTTTSTQSVSEPIVDFDDSGTSTSEENITSPSTNEQVVIPEPIAAEDEDSSSTFTTTTSETENIPSGDVVVEKGDALWSIASQFKGSEHSMGQVMLAMQRANPEAFGDNNINNLKVGAVLRAPTADELNQISKQEAYAQVLEQNGLWDDYVARVTGTSVSVASGDGGSAGSDQQEQETSGDLSLLAPGDSNEDSSGQGDSSEADELRKQLALAEEQLDASRIENQDMQSRIADLEARLSKFDELQKMVEIEDDSLAQLQADQAEETIEEVVSEEIITEEVVDQTPESLTEELLSADEDALLDEILAEGTEASSGEAIQELDEQVDSSDELGAEDNLVEEETLVEPEVVVEEETEIAPPAPVIVTEAEQREPSIFDGILPAGVIAMIPSGGIFSDPTVLGGLGGIVILLLGWILYKRRKGSADEDDGGITVSDSDDPDPLGLEEDLTPVHLAESMSEADTNISTPSDDVVEQNDAVQTEEEDEFARTAVISQADMPEPAAPAETAAAEQDDVLNEVDVYLAYGLYDNAEELLTQSLDDNPGRADYRSKLLDTYFATKNTAAFVGEAEKLKSMGDAGAKYWDRVQAMGYELSPENDLFSGGKDSGISAAELEIAKPEMADFDLSDTEDNTNFSTTDFNLGEDEFTSTQTVEETQAVGGTQELLELPGTETAPPPSEASGELEFTLDADANGGDESEDISEISFDMPDELDLDADSDENAPDISFDFDMDDDPKDSDSTEFAIESTDDDEELEATAVIREPAPASTKIPADEEETVESAQVNFEADENDSLDLDEIPLMEGHDDLDIGDQDLDDDLDPEAEDEIASAFEGADLDLDQEEDSGGDLDLEDSLSLDMDDNASTGTFAPGDFDDPDETVIPEVDIDDIGDLMLPDDVDEVSTKLDLARAFIDMGDAEGARGSLDEVLAEGSDEQKAEASQLMDKL